MKNFVKLLMLKDEKEQKAVKMTVLFLSIGLAFGVVAKFVFDITGDLVFAMFLLIPILLYLVITDKITELRTPSGWGVTFVKTARDSVEKEIGGERVEVDHNEQIAKEGLDRLYQQTEKLDTNRAPVMVITIGFKYLTGILIEYIDVLKRFPKFKYIVFRDLKKRFIAFVSIDDFEQKLTSNSEQIIESIKHDKIEDYFDTKKLVKQTVLNEATNASVLQMMTQEQLQAVAVVNNSFSFIGIVEREQLLGRMIVALTKAASSET